MKNFIKKRWFRVIVTVAPSALAISVVLVMFFFGWRLTYAPELESSWEAISAVAAWVGVIASFVAIWFAIQVPRKIADRQDKIALFEKRTECFNIIRNLLLCAEHMKDWETNKSIQVIFRVYFGQPDNIYKDMPAGPFVVYLKQKQAVLVSGEFLFEHYNVDLLQEILDTGSRLIMETTGPDEVMCEGPLSAQAIQLKAEYCRLCQQFENQYINDMEKEMYLFR